ncbi:MAG TPA: hypothetical protein VG944_23175 [Fimbriimonas sp.]|nr:hypothetical protein [Fimbriimonas sp.]
MQSCARMLAQESLRGPNSRAEYGAYLRQVIRTVMCDWIIVQSPGWPRLRSRVLAALKASSDLCVDRSFSNKTRCYAKGGKGAGLFESTPPFHPEMIPDQVVQRCSSVGLLTPQAVERPGDLASLLRNLLAAAGRPILLTDLCRCVAKLCSPSVACRLVAEEEEQIDSVSDDELLDPVKLLEEQETLTIFRDFLLSPGMSRLQRAAVLLPMSRPFLVGYLGFMISDFATALEMTAEEVSAKLLHEIPITNDAEIARLMGLSQLTDRELANRVSGARMQALRRDWPKFLKSRESL